ncbi:MAG: hypothetical protein ACP5U2_00355 [Bryobacteraceae bacterium]
MKAPASRLWLAAGVVLLAGAALAQPGARPQHRTYGSPHGFGNVVFPGTGTAPPPGMPFSGQSSFAQRLGATVSGWPGYPGVLPMDGLRRRVAVVPMIWPVYVGGYYPYWDPQPQVTIVMPLQPAPAPVTINQYFASEARPQERETVTTYQAPVRAPVEPPAESVTFLIALKDSSVYMALAYWVEGDTLHYITPQGQHNKVSLDLVDRALSEKLNQGRKVEFKLPKP